MLPDTPSTTVRSVKLYMVRSVHLINHAQPQERQIRVNRVNYSRFPGDEFGIAPGANYLRVATKLHLHPFHDALYKPHVAENHPRLQRGNRVAPDGCVGPDELDAVQLRRP